MDARVKPAHDERRATARLGRRVVNQSQHKRIDPAGIVIAAMLLAAAGVIAWDMTTLQITSTYGVGPKAMPIVVSTGLVLLAVGNLVMALRGDLPARESADPKAIQRILGGLAALIAVIGFGGGFVIATALLFAMTAAAFGRRAFFADLAIGFVLGLAVYLVFTKLLSLSLPAGPIEQML
jgi:putative tricarboxylic transport membrane protein